MEEKRPRQKKITTTIDIGDFEYCAKHGLKYAHLIRAGVRDHRVHTEDPNADLSVRELHRQKERISIIRDRLLTILRKKLTDEEFTKEMQKL